jgi:TRAP-type transport system small permease protein
MRSKSRFELVEAGIGGISRWASYVGMAALLAMMMLTVADVFMRYVFNHPILGALELTEYMMVPVVFLGLAWCARQGGNVKVDLVTERLGLGIQRFLDAITHLIGVIVAGVISWENFGEAVQSWKAHKASDMLEVPAYPFYLVLAVGCLLLCVVLLIQLIHVLIKGREVRG